MVYKKIQLRDKQEFITVNVLLKIVGLISTGGMVKNFLKTNTVYVNGEIENRRGRKLYTGDKININDEGFEIEKCM